MSVIDLEQMSDEQLKSLRSFIYSAIRDAEVEEGWREGNDDMLFLLRGLVKHLSTEFLGEEPDVNCGYEQDDEDDNEY